MSLVQSNDVVEQIPSAAADPALSNTVLPRAPDGSLRGDDLHGSNRSWNFPSILRIVIKDEELGGRLIGEGLSQLLGNPGASGMTRNVEVKNAPAVMANDEEAVQKAERDGGYGKEVHGGDGFAMVAKKGQPTLRWFWVSGRAFHPAGDSSLRNIEAKHEELAMNARSTSCRILRYQAIDQVPDLFRDPFSANLLSHLRRSGSSTCGSRHGASAPRSPE